MHPHNACTTVCLNFILIRIVTSGDNHASLSERAALRGKHFESSDYITGGSLKGDVAEAKRKINQKVASGFMKSLMSSIQKAATVSLEKHRFFEALLYISRNAETLVLFSVPGRVMNTSP